MLACIMVQEDCGIAGLETVSGRGAQRRLRPKGKTDGGGYKKALLVFMLWDFSSVVPPAPPLPSGPGAFSHDPGAAPQLHESAAPLIPR